MFQKRIIIVDSFVSQTKELTKQMTELAKLNTKLSFQSSIASLNFTQSQLLEDIEKIDKNEFTKPTMFQFKGNTVFFNGKTVTDGMFGRTFNETETKEALLALKEKLLNSLETVKNTGKNLDNSLKQFD